VNKIGTVVKEKIPKEIIILGVIVILYSFQGLPTFDFAAYASKFSPLSEELILVRYIFSITLRIFLFIAGVGVLFRRDIFRKSILFICLFTICTVYWKHPFLCFKNSFMFNINQGVVPVDLMPKINLITWFCVVTSYIMDIVISVFLIYLFTRPKIKEQFK